MGNSNLGTGGVLWAQGAFGANTGADFLAVGNQELIERYPKAFWHDAH